MIWDTLLFVSCSFLFASAQTKQDTLAIKQAALNYIESQHTPNPDRMERALHPRMVKRTFGKTKRQEKTMSETNTESMILLAENYNKNGDKFPASPRKEINYSMSPTEQLLLSFCRWMDRLHAPCETQWHMENYQCSVAIQRFQKANKLIKASCPILL